MRRLFGSDEDAYGLSGRPCMVVGSTRMMVPFSRVGPSRRWLLWLFSAPPSAAGGLMALPIALPGGSAHGLPPLAWPQSVTSALAPSPPETHRSPSGPKVTVPIECVSEESHQSLRRTCSCPTIVSLVPLAVSV